MRRSTHVFAPLLAAAAMSSPIGPRTIAQETDASGQSYTTPYDAFETLRHGFGTSFREHPWMWALGATWSLYVFSSGG
jgi:hypothetical protein